MTATNTPEVERDCQPFLDSILSDIHALPVPVRQRFAAEVADRYAAPPAVDWASLVLAAAIAAGVLLGRGRFGGWLAGAHVHHHFSQQAGWFALGLAAVVVLDGVAGFAGSVYAAIAVRRHRRQYATPTTHSTPTASTPARIEGDHA